ncbi:AMP-binding protein [Jatrophihabitans sp.]|jgi:acyl-CoA synthetase (AMP-forming)/AMP-acid ligase II|uniref:AMP-binding protein n=1 Tax=Jatrophihabitans sp. TaxID=1932789 RepID=UPI002EE42390
MHSDLPDVAVPDSTLPGYVLARSAEFADRVAVTDAEGRRSYTYAELATAVRQAAGGLRSRGFGKGDVVAILSPNVPDYVVAYYAAVTAGGSVLHLNPLDTIADHVRTIGRTKTSFLMAGPGTPGKELAEAAGIQQLVLLDAGEGEDAFASLLADSAEFEEVAVSPAHDIASVMNSSGSTGLPKSVALTHRNLVAATLQTVTGIPLQPGDTTLAVPPFHHAFGLIMVMHATLAQGATLVTMPRFEPTAYLQAIQDHRITRLYVVPTLVALLTKSPLVDKYDLTSVRDMVSGGAALDPEMAQQCRDRLNCGLAQGYGMTEAMMSLMQRDFSAKTASVGRPSVNVTIKVVDPDTKQERRQGEIGEVLIRGPHVMQGYLDDEEATRDALDADGYLRTGDLGWIGSDGELTLGDRLKEIIKYKGHQVSPTELEHILLSHPKVSDAAVIGIPDEEASEIPKAFVVLSEPVDLEEIMSFVNDQVAPYKKIRRCEIVDTIPKTAVGKIARQELKRAS